ncbi:uncharacterized protein STEHIDRAFT_157882 [Stereum hirsutum FP-91666 SS1]|uniref:uncharacterized protein n=1 Tax=Stereum hirsutum (strain FP-91666) TaxID=721885 RepID=UPI00044492B2|nr:uncharacterized protein STEHIDRAFT_157882 [Stereum hirsutum FP-91666 SS1]EIM85236.1 hypothetical protein STEHIDRAFT_157882 [Stereum hirsutum FP-91666 SS1]
MAPLSLSVFGRFQGLDVHILVDASSPYSKISSRFSLLHKVQQSIDVAPTDPSRHAVTSRGLVVVPTDGGSYRSHMCLFLDHFGNFDIILGLDWVSACSPSPRAGSFIRPPLSITAALPAAHMWRPDVPPSGSNHRPPSLPPLDHLGLEQTSAAQVGSSATHVGPSTAAHQYPCIFLCLGGRPSSF